MSIKDLIKPISKYLFLKRKIYRLNHKNVLSKKRISKKDIELAEKNFNTILKVVCKSVEKKDDLNQLLNKRKLVELKNYNIYPNEDPLGPVCDIENNKNKFFRLIKKDSVESFSKLYQTGILHTLSRYNLIPSFSISNFIHKDYPIILEADRLQIDRRSQHFSRADTFNALIEVCFIKKVCEKNNVSLFDPHINNFLINNSLPIYCDYGSFVYGQKYDDRIIVDSIGFKLLFNYFPKSYFYSNECYLGNRDYYESSLFLKKFLDYHFFHSSKIAFDNYVDFFINKNVSLHMSYLLFRQNESFEDLSLYKKIEKHYKSGVN